MPLIRIKMPSNNGTIGCVHVHVMALGDVSYWPASPVSSISSWNFPDSSMGVWVYAHCNDSSHFQILACMLARRRSRMVSHKTDQGKYSFEKSRCLYLMQLHITME